MKSLEEKIISLTKAIETLKVKEESTQNDILAQMGNILLEMAKKIDEMEENQSEINEYVTVLDENLGNIEDDLYGFEEEDEEFNSDDYIDVLCKNCNETLAIEKSLANSEGEIVCPNCRNLVNLNLKEK